MLLSCVLKPEKFQTIIKTECNNGSRVCVGLLYLYLIYSGFSQDLRTGMWSISVPRFSRIYIINVRARDGKNLRNEYSHPMKEREKTEWIAHNELLQSAYRKWLHGNQKEKEAACSAMQRELEWPPFTDYVSSNSMANPSGISRYGNPVT